MTFRVLHVTFDSADPGSLADLCGGQPLLAFDATTRRERAGGW